MKGMRQNELMRVPKTKLVTSKMRFSGSKACKCGVAISKNKDLCLQCKESA